MALISLIIAILGILLLWDSRSKGEVICSIGILICGFFLGVLGLLVRKDISEAKQMEIPKHIEYPASEYRLQLRITEFEGQRDTTYVLIKKIKELSYAEDNVQ